MAKNRGDGGRDRGRSPSDEQLDLRLSPQYFLHLITEVGALLARLYDRRSGLSRNQTQIITSLLQNDGQTQTDLAHDLNIHKVSIGIYITELEAMGLVERRAHPTDRRAKCIYLTPLLHAHKHLGVAHYADVHNLAIEGIGRQDYLTMLDCIALMRGNLVGADERDRAEGRVAQGVPSERP